MRQPSERLPGLVEQFFRKQFNSIHRRVIGRKTFYDAQKYVRTDAFSGWMQAQILIQAGCEPGHEVLEIGCGALSAGAHLIDYLEEGRYTGIEPNTWLVETAGARRATKEIIEAKKPTFVSNTEFDASSTGKEYDYVLSHSILSHAAHWQLPLFLEKVGRVLAPGGMIFASLYLSEGNRFGNSGTPDKKDSMDAEWVYPGVSWFTLETVQKVASVHGLTAVHRPDITEWYVGKRPLQCHDWFEFGKAL